MNRQDALDRIGRRLIRLDEINLRLGCAPLSGQDLTPGQRANEIIVRLNEIVAGGPDVDTLEVASAHLVAWILAAAEAEEVRIEAGDMDEAA